MFSLLFWAHATVKYAVVEAGFASLPITRTTFGVYFRALDFTELNLGRHDQFFLAPQPLHLLSLALKQHKVLVESEGSNKSRGTSNQGKSKDEDGILAAFFWSIYTTPVSIGNPPLSLKATVDTSWSTLFVPSANCTNDPYEFQYCKGHPLYNSSLSATYEPDLTPTSVLYTGPCGLHTWGKVSRDSLHVAGIEVRGQEFEEATIWRPNLATKDEFFDSALGLALFPARNGDHPEDFSGQSPFHNMMEQRLLYENIFSLKFPRNDSETGELTFGGLPPNLRQRNMIEVPLDHSKTDDSDPVWRYYTMNGWQIGVESMSMTSKDSAKPDLVMDKANIAVVASSFPFIGLPDDVAETIHKAIGIRQVFDWIDCSKRLELPDWTITFGPNSQNITLTPWDYLIEFDSKHFGHSVCISGFFSLQNSGNKGFILLGAPFLNGLHSVFDGDRQSISLMNRQL